MDVEGNEPHHEPVAVAQGVCPFDAFSVYEGAVLTPEVANLDGSGIVIDHDTAVMAADEPTREPDVTIWTATDQKLGLNQWVVRRFQNERALIGSVDWLKNDFHGTTSVRADRPALMSLNLQQ
jgi:hypothetical protein